MNAFGVAGAAALLVAAAAVPLAAGSDEPSADEVSERLAAHLVALPVITPPNEPVEFASGTTVSGVSAVDTVVQAGGLGPRAFVSVFTSCHGDGRVLVRADDEVLGIADCAPPDGDPDQTDPAWSEGWVETPPDGVLRVRATADDGTPLAVRVNVFRALPAPAPALP